MSIYIKIEDFKGQDVIAKDKFTTSDLQHYIDKFEVRYLQDLLGSVEYETFKTDFELKGTEPTAPKYVEIWNEFSKDDNCGIRRSEGIKEMLGLFIFFEYTRDQPVVNTIGGNQKNEQANSTAAASIDTNIITNYNQALETYYAIQWIIWNNPNTYNWDNFNGQYRSIIGIV